MELSQEIDDYIKESIEYSIGLPVSTHTLELKLRVSKEACYRLRGQCLSLQRRLREKDDVIDRSRYECASVEEVCGGKSEICSECANLLSQCTRWEKECSLYDHDREALMEFGNEAHERAREAEIQVHELEELRRMTEELQFYKHQCEMQSPLRPSFSLFATLLAIEFQVRRLPAGVTPYDCTKARAPGCFFWRGFSYGTNFTRDIDKQLCLRSSTKKILALAAEVKTLQNDKEHLRINLARAEEEVNVLFEENRILDKENKRLLRLHKERCTLGSGEKHTSSTSAKGNKRKSSPKTSSPIERKIDFCDVDSPRKPLSPLQHNSPSPECIRSSKPRNPTLSSSPPVLQLKPKPPSKPQKLTTQRLLQKKKKKKASRTRVFAQNVPWTSTVDDIRLLFEKFGTVVDVELSMHNKTRNRGLAFVSMGSHEEALAALNNLESSEFEGRTLKLTWARPIKKKPNPVAQPKPGPIHNLFVANLPYQARAKDLKELFNSENANVVSAEIIFHENPRRSAGYGFVSFNTKQEAEAALSALQGKTLMGRQIQVARSKKFLRQETKANIELENVSSQS
ncbi:RNA-binding (RRM/RBD/RNP motifs) family protein [Actinidia rufa]|uniref:RNA-binding (RRM/RBD/RNP motifs) family protein n=1 Tax=Actinidia rufa TaxID=165716 RepID=A0A7J0EHB8_9ERIC|nr:RNA-binding (RRM/RBD/RNP motifs) family protein [Actinidia rufa]